MSRPRLRPNPLLAVLLACALYSFTPVAAGTAPPRLGTLLFSPAERMAITASRGGAGDAAATVDRSVTLEGVVRRNKGRSTAWINGAAVVEGSKVPEIGAPRIAPKQIVIDGRSVRIGETLNLDHGTRSDFLPGDARVERKR